METQEAANLCEKAMVQSVKSSGDVNLYMAGFVDAMFDSGIITKDDHSTLYAAYAEGVKTS